MAGLKAGDVVVETKLNRLGRSTRLACVLTHGEIAWQRPHCVAEAPGFEPGIGGNQNVKIAKSY
jgi:hypothetical protein